MDHKTVGKLMLITSLLLGLLFFIWVGTTMVRNVFNLTSTEDLYKSEWRTIICGNPGITFKAPFQVEKNFLDITPEIYDLVEEMETYNFQAGTNFLMMVNTIKYIPEVDADLKGAALGSLEQLNNVPEIQEIDFKEEVQVYSNRPAIKQKGTLTHHGLKQNFTNLVIVDANNLWQLTLMHPEGDKYGERLIEEIISSISLE